MILKDTVSPFIQVQKRQRQFTGPRAGTIDPGADIDLRHLGPGRPDPGHRQQGTGRQRVVITGDQGAADAQVVSVEELALESDGQDFRILPFVLAAFLRWFSIHLDLGPAFHRPGAFNS